MSDGIGEPLNGRPIRVSARAGALPQSSTVELADVASRMRRAGETIIDLSAGRASESTDGVIGEAGRAAIRSGHTHQTPARGDPDYLLAVSAKLARENRLACSPDSEIVTTLGCKNGLVLALLATIDPGDEVIIEDPCFVSYAPTIILCGGVPVTVPVQRPRWTWTEADLERAVTERTRAILFCSPGNPTGTVHTAADLGVISEVAQRHGLAVIADEIYEAVTWGGRKHLPIASLPGMKSRTIGLMGMTKSYAMGGWRIGYAYGPDNIVERMVMIQGHFSTSASSISQKAAERALQPDISARFSQTLWREWESRCLDFTARLSESALLTVPAPEAGYYAWFDIAKSGLSSSDYASRLLAEEKVVVVPGGTFGPSCDTFVRATCVKSRDDIAEAAFRIKRFTDRHAGGNPHQGSSNT